jgi:preprotein translocase subunit YajC
MTDSKILVYFIIPFFFIMCKPQKSEENDKDNQLSIPGVRTCFGQGDL